MVAFGKALTAARRPGWKDAYVDYEGLKSLLEEQTNPDDLEANFEKKLRWEIEKVSLFALNRLGEIAKWVGALRMQKEHLHLQVAVVCETRSEEDLESTAPVTIQRPLFELESFFPSIQTESDTTLAYTRCAVELLHWQRFVCINAVGFRKILKKFHKIYRHRQPSSSLDIVKLPEASDPHLQHLVSSSSVDALASSLWQACQELDPGKPLFNYSRSETSYQDDDDTKERHAWIRLHCTVSLIHAIRKYAESMNARFTAFLSSKSMIALPDGDESLRALRVFLHFQPDALLSMDASRVESTWENYSFLKGSLPNSQGADKDWGGVESVSLLLNLTSTLLYTVNYYIVAPTANRYAILLGTNGAFGATLVGASSLAAIFAAFLYSWWYTRLSFRSALLFSSFCPCVGNILYSLAISYRSMTMAFVGRLFVGLGSAEVVNRQLISACVSFEFLTSASAYFVAASAAGMSIGPLMAALLDIYSGRDVRVDLHMPFTPAGGIVYNHVTSPGLVMAGIWLIQGISLVLFFREPARINSGNEEDENLHDSESSLDERVKVALESVGVTLSQSELSPLVEGKIASIDKMTPWQQFASDMGLVWRLVFGNMALPVTFLIFGFIELVDEVLISSCSMVCRRYFGWQGSAAGFIVASLGALVLPAHFVVERAAQYYEERSIIKNSLIFIGLCLVAILNYEGLIFDFVGLAAAAFESDIAVNSTLTDDTSEAAHPKNSTDHINIAIGGEDILQVLNRENEVPYDWGAGAQIYLVFLSAIFLGTIILEGVDTSVMAKVTPPALNGAFLNSGLLATLVGTLGRVCGDSIITLSALIDKDIFTDFVNATFFPMIPMVLIGLFLVRRYYKLLG